MDINQLAGKEAAEKIINDYKLEVHPEGGYFAEVYTSAAVTDAKDRRPAGAAYTSCCRRGQSPTTMR